MSGQASPGIPGAVLAPGWQHPFVCRRPDSRPVGCGGEPSTPFVGGDINGARRGICHRRAELRGERLLRFHSDCGWVNPVMGEDPPCSTEGVAFQIVMLCWTLSTR